ncbi:MAG: helix-turn-helix domain-containing protein [Candidatus Izemoplasmatales bacterium]|jgi:DNA-binding HxlR family transcriptional regulator|nr:helix-turn-helix domain-containing protein [Candidatus Izemoplasmatales bacterium]
MNKNKLVFQIEHAISIIGGKWKTIIIASLFENKKRFSELMKSISGITQRALSNQLKELVEDGIIEKVSTSETSLRKYYKLTEVGISLSSVITELSKWDSTIRK